MTDELFRKAAKACAAFNCQSFEAAIHSVIAPEFEASDAEIERLKEVIRVNDLCHDKDQKVGPREYADGCSAQQRKLFGCAPDADRITELEKQNAELRLWRDKMTEIGDGMAEVITRSGARIAEQESEIERLKCTACNGTGEAVYDTGGVWEDGRPIESSGPCPECSLGKARIRIAELERENAELRDILQEYGPMIHVPVDHGVFKRIDAALKQESSE